MDHKLIIYHFSFEDAVQFCTDRHFCNLDIFPGKYGVCAAVFKTAHIINGSLRDGSPASIIAENAIRGTPYVSVQGTSYHSILGLWSLLTQSIIHSSCLCTRVQLCSANSDFNHTDKVHSRIWWLLAIAHIPIRVVNSTPGTVLTMPPSPPLAIHIITPKLSL